MAAKGTMLVRIDDELKARIHKLANIATDRLRTDTGDPSRRISASEVFRAAARTLLKTAEHDRELAVGELLSQLDDPDNARRYPPEQKNGVGEDGIPRRRPREIASKVA
jgi:hypothetical protein